MQIAQIIHAFGLEIFVVSVGFFDAAGLHFYVDLRAVLGLAIYVEPLSLFIDVTGRNLIIVRKWG